MYMYIEMTLSCDSLISIAAYNVNCRHHKYIYIYIYIHVHVANWSYRKLG